MPFNRIKTQYFPPSIHNVVQNGAKKNYIFGCKRKTFIYASEKNSISTAAAKARGAPQDFLLRYLLNIYMLLFNWKIKYTHPLIISLMMTMHSSSLDKMTHDIKTSKKEFNGLWQKIFKRKHLTLGCNFFNIQSHNKRFAEKFQL